MSNYSHLIPIYNGINVSSGRFSRSNDFYSILKIVWLPVFRFTR